MKRKFLKTITIFISLCSFSNLCSIDAIIANAVTTPDSPENYSEESTLIATEVKDEIINEEESEIVNSDIENEEEEIVFEQPSDIDDSESNSTTNDIIVSEDTAPSEDSSSNLSPDDIAPSNTEETNTPHKDIIKNLSIEGITLPNNFNPILHKDSYITTQNKESIKYSNNISFRVKGEFLEDIDLNSILVFKDLKDFDLNNTSNNIIYKNKIVFAIENLENKKFNIASLKSTVTREDETGDMIVSINTSSLISGKHKVNIFASDNKYSNSKIESNFTVDNVAPTVSIKVNGAFNDDSFFTSTKAIKIKSNYLNLKTVDNSKGNDFIEFLAVDNNIDKSKSGFNIYDGNKDSILPDGTSTNNYNISIEQSGNIYKIIFTAYDLAMNKSEKEFNILIDNEAPKVNFIPSHSESDINKTPVFNLEEKDNKKSHYLLNFDNYKKLEFKIDDILLYNSIDEFKNTVLPTVKVSSNNTPLSVKNISDGSLDYITELEGLKFSEVKEKAQILIEEREDGVFLIIEGLDGYLFKDNHYNISFDISDVTGNKLNYKSFLTIDSKSNTFKKLSIDSKTLSDDNGEFVKETTFFNKAAKGTLTITKPLSGLISNKLFLNNLDSPIVAEKEDDYTITYKFDSSKNGDYSLTSNFTSNMEYRLNNFSSLDETIPWVIDDELPYLMSFSIPGNYSSQEKKYYYSKAIYKDNNISAKFGDDISLLESVKLELKDSSGKVVSTGSSLDNPSKEFTSSLKFNNNTEGSFELIAEIHDRAKNGLNKKLSLGTLIIDNTSPEISVSGISGNYIEAEKKSYINKSVDLSLTVMDTNPDDNSSNLIINNNTSGMKKTLSSNGSYEVKATATDLAGNKTSVFVNPYGSNKVSSTSFVIDTIAPVIKCKNIQLEKHYNKKIKPEIEINEETLFQEMKLNDSFYDGEIIEKDGEYKLIISAEDKALNKGLIEVPFVIDTVAPEIKISGLTVGELNKGPITPKIEVNEPMAKVTASVNGENFSGGKISGDGKFSLVVYAVDRAGNKSKETANFHLRTNPLDILLKNITDGQVIFGSIIPSIDKNDEIEYSYKLNGQDYDGSEITTPGDYVLEIISKDKLGIENSKTINFILKSKAEESDNSSKTKNIKNAVLPGSILALAFTIGTILFIVKKKH